MNKQRKNVAIIGGGASGMVAAIMFARKGVKVSLFEKNKKLGRKILATGNGRCNVTNDFIEHTRYHTNNPNFLNPIFKEFKTNECIEFFRSIGVALIKKQNGRFYPMSNQSSSISDALIYELQRLGVKIFLDTTVEKVDKKKDLFYLFANKKEYIYDVLIIATGGISMKKLGSSGSGYEFAQTFRHTLIDTKPSLVQLVTEENTKSIAGVKIEALIKLQDYSVSSCGDILFTSYGISGSSSLEISRYIEPLCKTKVVIDCLPKISKDALKTLLTNSLKVSSDKPLYLWLNGFLNNKLACFILEKINLQKDQKASSLTTKELRVLCFTIKNLTFTAIGTKGFEYAEVTAGGINTQEINPKTFESKIVKNLYFLGEVLDVDGDCGGYNLHFAWASGYLCAKFFEI